jgi:hypothetical protein
MEEGGHDVFRDFLSSLFSKRGKIKQDVKMAGIRFVNHPDKLI